MKKEKVHMVPSYLVDNRHRVSVAVIGCGGTGSHVLTNLAMINASFVALGKQPMLVTAYDDDIVEPHNVGRQVFSPADVGKYKAVVMIQRINRYYGFDWDSVTERYNGINFKPGAASNVTFICVDSVKSRRSIYDFIYNKNNHKSYYSENPYYVFDIGNDRYTGQVFLGTVVKIQQPNKTDYVDSLPNFIDEFPDITDTEEDLRVSCSSAEALVQQDLFINKILATYATTMFWNLLRDFILKYRGIYLNLETMDMKKVPIC